MRNISNLYQGQGRFCLTHLSWCKYMSVNRCSIGSDNYLSPIRHQAIIYKSARLLSIGPLWTNEWNVKRKKKKMSLTKIHLKTSSAKWRSFCPWEDELIRPGNVFNIVSKEDVIGQWCQHNTVFTIFNGNSSETSQTYRMFVTILVNTKSGKPYSA